MAKVPQPPSAFEQALQVQLRHLRSSCSAYDVGDHDEYIRIAQTVRVLVHDTGQSTSVLEHLGRKSIKFHSWAFRHNSGNLSPETPLVGIRMDGSSISFVPHLNQISDLRKQISFTAWWDGLIFRSEEFQMSRRELVLGVANQLGGAHVASALSEQLSKVINANAPGYKFSIAGSPEQDLLGFERATLRQIGFEVLDTLEPEMARIIGNRTCDCGSGKKRRYCHDGPRPPGGAPAT